MTREMTITEALAELKTLDKRITKKREAINTYLMRQDALKDPLAAQGGSVTYIATERQAIADLENNIIAIRTQIQKINGDTIVTINGIAHSITEWLIWRRDVAPKQVQHIAQMRGGIDSTRRQAQAKGVKVLPQGSAAEQPTDFIVNVDEKGLADEAEQLETTLGTLDGLLSLKNATVLITV